MDSDRFKTALTIPILLEKIVISVSIYLCYVLVSKELYLLVKNFILIDQFEGVRQSCPLELVVGQRLEAIADRLQLLQALEPLKELLNLNGDRSITV